MTGIEIEGMVASVTNGRVTLSLVYIGDFVVAYVSSNNDNHAEVPLEIGSLYRPYSKHKPTFDSFVESMQQGVEYMLSDEWKPGKWTVNLDAMADPVKH
ncbi:hypothetical protein DRQ53_07980 [bacterium]|nr:MAG: hypothetical protein DRQ53_07980 [bacterium]